MLSRRRGLTLIEILVVVAIVSLLVAITLPAVQRARESARRMDCMSRLRQCSLGIANYHSTHQQLPMQGGGTAEAGGIRTLADTECNHHRLNYAVAILPFIEEQARWEEISTPLMSGPLRFPAMGPVPWINDLPSSRGYNYSPWAKGPSLFRCPSDPAVDGPSGAINYAACMGDGIRELGCAYEKPQYRFSPDTSPVRFDDATKRGLFANWHAFRWSDCRDGLSSTILLAEIAVFRDSTDVRTAVANGIQQLATNPERCLQAVDASSPTDYMLGTDLEHRGQRWADAAITFSGFNTVLPPNSPSCTEVPSNGAHSNWFGGIVSAGSYHAGGVHVAKADGSVEFVSDQISAVTDAADKSSVFTGNLTHPPGTASPYGVWGALGTRASSEASSL